MGLDADQVASIVVRTISEEVVEPDFHHRRGGGVGADVTADVGSAVISAKDDGHRVPSENLFDALFEFDFARVRRFLLERDGVAIVGVERGVLDDHVFVGQVVGERTKNDLRPLRTFRPQQGFHRLEPFLELDVR